MTSKFYLRLLQTGAIASLLTVFLVFSGLLFPYITSKQLTFNILTEFLIVFWLIFIWKFPSYRPKRSFITWGIAAFLLAITWSCFSSVDPLLSFWGDAERMLGVFHIIHFFFLYLILITVFRNEKDWQILLGSSVVIATVVSLIGLAGNPYSTIGNTAYVSGYIIFNIYFATLLFYRAKGQNWRWSLLIPVLIMLLEFSKTRTSGAIIGLGISVLFVIFLIGVLHQNKKIKIAAWSALAISILILTFIFSQQEATWFQNSFLKNLTSKKNTFQTRLVSWEAAAKDFHNHPWFGVGFGNYADIFDRHFNARFYEYSRGDTYFDRAHNNLIDIVSTTGLVGLIAYLSIFIAVAFYLLRIIKQDRHNLEPIILIGLFVAYFIQNLAIFDSLVTYIGLMISLAYIYYLINPNSEKETEKKIPETSLLAIGLLLVLILTNHFNIKPWKTFSGVINGYRLLSQGQIMESVSTYQEAFKNETPLDRDGKNSFLNGLMSNSQFIGALNDEDKKTVIDYALRLSQENLLNNPQDSLMQLQTAQMYGLAFNFTKDEAYTEKALEHLDLAIALSPQRLPLYFLKANILMMLDRSDEAIALVTKSIEFNPDFPDAYCNLFKFYKMTGEDELAFANGDKCVDFGGAETLNMSTEFLELAEHYYLTEDWDRTLVMVKQLVIFQPESAEAWNLLSEIHQNLGNEQEASDAAFRARVLSGQGGVLK